MNLNDIVGVALLILGGLMVIIALAAFVKVQFFTEGTKKGFTETLKQINELLKSWEKILLLIPPSMRHIFVLMPLGLVVGGVGIWILTKKPI